MFLKNLKNRTTFCKHSGTNCCHLGELKAGERATILDYHTCESCEFAPNIAERLHLRLLQLGLLKGALIQVMHEAPFGSDPIAVSVRGALVALRRNEANLIMVQRVGIDA